MMTTLAFNELITKLIACMKGVWGVYSAKKPSFAQLLESKVLLESTI